MSLCTKASAGLLAVLPKHPGPIFWRLTTRHFFPFLISSYVQNVPSWGGLSSAVSICWWSQDINEGFPLNKKIPSIWRGTQLKVKRAATGKLQAGLFLLFWMDISTNFKGSSLVNSKICVDFLPLFWAAELCLLESSQIAAGWASSMTSGSVRWGLVQKMPTVTIRARLCTSITSPFLLTCIKSLSNTGTYWNIGYSPLYSYRCSFPMEVLNILMARLLLAE